MVSPGGKKVDLSKSLLASPSASLTLFDGAGAHICHIVDWVSQV